MDVHRPMKRPRDAMSLGRRRRTRCHLPVAGVLGLARCEPGCLELLWRRLPEDIMVFCGM